ncbi:MAG: 30S ribosomal protein S15 [Methanobacteriota archaeon]|nr:MAG: 30S ribosomal protein S15 [Euryarchaeota archaeon]
MARMHARRKGRSGSKRPLTAKSPDWVPVEADEVEETVARLAAQGKRSAEIGLILRDQYAVPNVRLATGKTVSEIMRARGTKFEMPEDLGDLMRKAVELQTHLKAHPRDLSNLRGLQLIESKIRRLARYYQGEGVLPPAWDYSVKIQELAAK